MPLLNLHRTYMKSLNYIGSKRTLMPTLRAIIAAEIPDPEHRTFTDLFAGTGIVGFTMQSTFQHIISNDLEYYSYVINRALLMCLYSEKIEEWICTLDALEGVEGLIYTHFSPNPDGERMFWTSFNAKKCDAIRVELENLRSGGELTESEYYFLLASLLVSVDKVANTSCVYGAYLKTFKKSACNEFVLHPIHTIYESKKAAKNQVYNTPAEALVRCVKMDVVYMDPPYNARQYGGNYSPLNYIALYDETIEIKGKTGLMENYNKSRFSSKTRVQRAFEQLILDIKCRTIVLSYNNEGLLPFDTIKTVLRQKGDVILYRIQYTKFRSNTFVPKKKVVEYVWIVHVRPYKSFDDMNAYTFRETTLANEE